MSVSSLAAPPEEQLFCKLAELLPFPLAIVNENDERVFTNLAFTDALGYLPEDVPNLRVWWELAFPDASYRDEAQAIWGEAVRAAAEGNGQISPNDFYITLKHGEVRIFSISGAFSRGELLAVFSDVTERRQEKARLLFGNAILEHISIGAPLAEVLDFIVREIESTETGMLCSILLLDESGENLIAGAAPGLPEAYSRSIEGVAIGPEVGACGTAAYRGEDVLVGDIATSPLFKGYSKLALSNGLAACWSVPIKSSGGMVLGTFASYWPKPISTVSDNARRYVETATTLASIAIESARREQALREAYRGMLRAEAIGRIGSWSWDVASGRGTWSAQMLMFFGLDPLGDAPTPEAFVELVHPDDKAQLVEVMVLMKAGKVPPLITYRRHPSLGETCYLQPSLSAEHDGNGVITRLEGTLIDVTATKQAELRLHEQLAELQRWQQVTLGREGRILELKREVNVLLTRLNEAPRYQSAIALGSETV